jgi:hypothetical protein
LWIVETYNMNCPTTFTVALPYGIKINLKINKYTGVEVNSLS